MYKPHLAAGIIHLQQAVDRAGLVAGHLAQTLGGTARGGAQRHTVIPVFQQGQNGIDGCGFAGARAARKHHDVAGKRGFHGFSLQGRIGKPLRKFQRANVLLQILGRLGAGGSQHGQPKRDLALGQQKIRQIQIHLFLTHIGADLPLLDGRRELFVHRFGEHLDKIRRGGHQLAARQAGVAVARIAAQHIDQRGPHAHTALLRQLQLCGDQIGLREFHKKRFSA